MAYEIKFARITNLGKLPDRFLSSQHTESPNLAQSSMGEIFSIVEILSPWFPTAQIGQLVINNFAKSYYQGGSTSDLLNFEESLKKVNESLALATQNGETDWIGKLNGILAVIIDNNLHIAPTGKIEAYIFRDGKINHLTDGLSTSAEIHPLKTFSNVISGELKPHDKILLTSSDLFNHLSVESVRQIITLNNSSLSASQIAKLLKKARVKNVNLIIAGLYSKEELSGQVAEQDLETVFYLDKSTDTIVSQFKYLWNNIIAPVSKIIGGGIAKVTKKSINVTSEKIKNIKENRQVPKLAQTETPPAETSADIEPQDNFHREFLKETPRDDGLLKDEQINFSPDYVHYYKEKGTTKEKRASQIFAKIINTLVNFYQWILDLSRDKKRRNYLYISLAIILIIVIGLFAKFGSNKPKVGNLEAQKILDEAIAAEKEGDGFLSSGNQEEAKTGYGLAIEKARSILNNALVSKDATSVLNNSYEQMDKLTTTTRFTSLSALTTSPEHAVNFYIISGEAFFISKDAVFRGSVLGGTPEKAAAITASKGDIIASTRADKIIYLYTNSQMLFSFNSATNKMDQIQLASGKWETANSITNYIGSLYLLDGVVGQIYRHTSSQTTFGAGTNYLSTPSSALKQGVCVTVDGSIYVLTNTGKITKIQKSKIQDFSLKGIPTPFDKITEPLKIYTDSDTPSLYVLDNGQKRIVEIDKEGQFVHQYALPDSFDKIKDFVVSVKSRKIWVLQQDNIYELSI